MARRFARDATFPLIIFALNAYFAKNLFTLKFNYFMGSIESAYIALSRYMIANWTDLTWFPLWYGGIPFQNTYPPLLHAVVALASVSLRISPAQAHHLVTAIFYCLGPVTLYALALRLTRSRWYSFGAAWMYSILSPCLFLMPVERADLGGFIGLRRYQALVQYGEGPHVTSMALLPLALLGLDLALSKRSVWRCVLAALAMAAVAVTNWLGALALAIAVFTYLLARSGTRSAWKIWLTSFAIGVLAYALVCSWIVPSTILDVRYNAQSVGGDFGSVYSRLPLFAAAAILLAVAAKLAMHRFRISEPAQFFALFALFLAVLPLSEEWFHIAIVPAPIRYQLEMDMALCLAAVFALRALLARRSPTLRVGLVASLLLLSVFPARLDRRYARNLTKPVDIAQTVEYKTAKWFQANVGDGRVMAGGSVAYWLNVFSDTPQLSGGFDQGISNRFNSAVCYQLFHATGAGDRAADVADTWLRAYGVQAIAINGPLTRQAYHPFEHPEAFAKSFPEATRDGDDVIYWVPGRTGSLAHVLTSANVVHRRPIHGLDLAETQRYVQALHDPSFALATFHWTSRHSAEIQADLRSGQLISTQITYHPGWHATANGKPCPLTGDGLGQIVVEPGCDGACQVQLVYDGGWEMRTARIVSWSAWAGCLLAIAVAGWRRR